MSDPTQAPSKERMQVLARFLRSQIACADRPPIGRVELNNEEAEVCALALEQISSCPTCKSPEPHRHPTNDFGESTQSCKDQWHSRHEPPAAHTEYAVIAQHDETGRFWTGPRDALPPRYSEVSPAGTYVASYMPSEPAVDVRQLNRDLCSKEGHTWGPLAVNVCHRCHEQRLAQPPGPVSVTVPQRDLDKLIVAVHAVLDAYEGRFEIEASGGRYWGPIDDEIKALRSALTKCDGL